MIDPGAGAPYAWVVPAPPLGNLRAAVDPKRASLDITGSKDRTNYMKGESGEGPEATACRT
jgi:hypothetical protein